VAAYSCQAHDVSASHAAATEASEPSDILAVNKEEIEHWIRKPDGLEVGITKISANARGACSGMIEQENMRQADFDANKGINCKTPSSNVQDSCGTPAESEMLTLSNGFCGYLAAAIHKGDFELCRTLAQSCKNMNATDKLGHSALDIALQSGRLEIASMLVQHGANRNALEKCLIDCCGNNDFLGAARLLRCGPCTSRTVSIMIQQCKYTAVAFLVDHGINLTSRQKTSLCQESIKACARGDIRTMEALLASGASLDYQDEKGRSPLMYACLGKQLQSLQLLISKGANTEMCDNDGKDALEICLENNCEQMVQILLNVSAGKGTCDRTVRYLRSKDISMRVKACVRLKCMVHGCASEHLNLVISAALGDPERKVRAAARDVVLALQAARKADPFLIFQMIQETLDDTCTPRSMNAYRLLCALGVDHHNSEALRLALEGIRHPNPSIREEAFYILGSLGDKVASCKSTIFDQAIHEEIRDVRAAACAAFIAWRARGFPLDASDIKKHLAAASVRTAMLASVILSELGEEATYTTELAERFSIGLIDKEPEMRKAASVALGKLDEAGKVYTPGLADRAAKDDMWDVKVAALEALGAIGQSWGTRAAPPFVKVLIDRANNDPNRVVRNTAVEALGKWDRCGMQLPRGAIQTLKVYQSALRACGSASMPRAQQIYR